MKNNVLILAGGKGTRLRPYTNILPKPLMPLGTLPVIEVLISQLKGKGYKNILLAVGNMGRFFESILGDGSRMGVRIRYIAETKPLGTAGPIANAWDHLDENFLVINGDLLTTLNFSSLLKFHVKRKAIATVSVHQRSVKIDYGVLALDQEKRLLSYEEKPVLNYRVSMGINAFSKSHIYTFIQKDAYLDIPDLIARIKLEGLSVYCYEEKCSWYDIGRPDDFEEASRLFEEKPEIFYQEPE